MLSLSFECGTSTAGSNARWALRIRVNMSEMGSVIGLPTGFCDTGNEPVEGCFTELETRAGKFAQIAVTTATDSAAVDHTSGTGVARQLREPGVILLRFEFSAEGSEFFHCIALFFISFKP